MLLYTIKICLLSKECFFALVSLTIAYTCGRYTESVGVAVNISTHIEGVLGSNRGCDIG
jgi:hypothetical protein